MTGADRRKDMVRRIRESARPVPGAALAACYQVSRQLNEPVAASRVLRVCHTDEQLEEELCTVVDLGGCVKNVIVHHRIYGELEAELNIRSRRDVKNFLEDLRSGKSSPLKNITSNYHDHLIVADSEETLDLIEDALEEKKMLVRDDS